jgi:lysozyme
MDLSQIASRLAVDEGNVPYAYQDSKGLWTIGNGFLIDKGAGGRLPEPVRVFWLNYLIQQTIAEMIDFPSLAGMDDCRKQIIVCLLYNMGETHFEEFKNMLAYAAQGNYAGAADELQNSLWFSEVGVRGPIYVNILRTGVWQ